MKVDNTISELGKTYKISFFILEHQKCKRTSDVESHEEEERKPFLHEKQNNKKKSSKKGNDS